MWPIWFHMNPDLPSDIWKEIADGLLYEQIINSWACYFSLFGITITQCPQKGNMPVCLKEVQTHLVSFYVTEIHQDQKELKSKYGGLLRFRVNRGLKPLGVSQNITQNTIFVKEMSKHEWLYVYQHSTDLC